ncbi:MAG: hypothetical protein LBK73_16385 [Treponema sp.]|jgi:lipopolysaccharide biosynthesis regulator YciM|nr:hypothetical protein [Treponema sp.]
MSKDGLLCKKFLLNADWDGARAASPENEKDLSSEDYANFAYARCFQVTKDHKDGNYNDVIEAASKALIKGKNGQNTRALCIRAYGHYLNNNYPAAIADCESVIAQTSSIIETKKQQVIAAWQTAYEKMAENEEAEEAEKEQREHNELLHDTVFAYELIGAIYAGMDSPLEASKNYKQALLYRQFDIVSASPLLMDAYREVCKRVKDA